MSWSRYLTFLGFAVVLILIPGPDFAVVIRNALASGPRRGAWAAAGVATSAIVQGASAAAGLGAVIVRAEPVFEAIRWAGAVYLVILGGQALRAAARGRYPLLDADRGDRAPGEAFGGWRQGFLSNITNPKVLLFYLAVLPQFLTPGDGVPVLLIFAASHAVLGLLYLLAVTLGVHQARRLLARRRLRRGLDAVTGSVLVGFGARLATLHR